MSERTDTGVKKGDEFDLEHDIYVRDPHDDWFGGQIYIPAGVRVRVDHTRLDTYRDAKNRIDGTTYVTLVEVKSGYKHPEVKVGTLLHAAGVLEQESLEGRFVLPSEMHSGPEEEPTLATNPALVALAEQLAAEEAAKREAVKDPDRVLRLARVLPEPYHTVGEEGSELQVVERTDGNCKISIIGFPIQFIVPEEDLVASIAI